MPKGGHAHSGPAKDPSSRTSERAGFTVTALPNEGYRGEVPELQLFLARTNARQRAIWAELWTTPQACAWSTERWRWPMVADLAKWMARSDAADAPAAVATTVRQLRDDLGLTTAGLRANGWAIAAPQIAPDDVQDDEVADGDQIGQRRRERRLR